MNKKQKNHDCKCTKCGKTFTQTFFPLDTKYILTGETTKQTMCQSCIEAAPSLPSGWSGDLDAVPEWL